MASYRKKRRMKAVICKRCGKTFFTKTDRHYCGRECADAMRKPSNTKDTLCWSCKKATGGDDCSWANKFIPVDGWKATPTIVKVGLDGETQSFCVKKCPSFVEG